MFNETLFKRHTDGSVGSWQVFVEQNPAAIVRLATKVIGGKSVETRTNILEGKNIGRANETTPFEQALSEAKSKYQKKLDEGYVTSIDDAQTTATNGLGFRQPMLAQPIEKVKKWTFPVLASPKYDGHRMLATVQDKKVVLYSRGGKQIFAAHIENVLQIAYDRGQWCGTTLDGEIYQHGKTLQEIASLVKRPQKGSEHLTYYLYDAIDAGYTYSLRHALISGVAEACLPLTGSKPVELCPQSIVRDQAHLDAAHMDNLLQGFEGTMIRWGEAGYEEGKRSQSLMKRKDFQDDEFDIIGCFEGKPNERHNLKVGMYTCVTKNGVVFGVLAPGDMHEKHEHAVKGKKNVGLPMTIKFFNYTPDGAPYLPVALRIRKDL